MRQERAGHRWMRQERQGYCIHHKGRGRETGREAYWEAETKPGKQQTGRQPDKYWGRGLGEDCRKIA